MSQFLNMPLYAPLKDISLFQKVRADGMCVYWNDDIDICPDICYMQSVPENRSDV